MASVVWQSCSSRLWAREFVPLKQINLLMQSCVSLSLRYMTGEFLASEAMAYCSPPGGRLHYRTWTIILTPLLQVGLGPYCGCPSFFSNWYKIKMDDSSSLPPTYTSRLKFLGCWHVGVIYSQSLCSSNQKTKLSSGCFRPFLWHSI